MCYRAEEYKTNSLIYNAGFCICSWSLKQVWLYTITNVKKNPKRDNFPPETKKNVDVKIHKSPYDLQQCTRLMQQRNIWKFLSWLLRIKEDANDTTFSQNPHEVNISNNFIFQKCKKYNCSKEIQGFGKQEELI